MNDGNESAWSVVWVMALFGTIGGLSTTLEDPSIEVIGPILVLLCGELFMLALPSIWESWKRGAPSRQRAREARQERAAAQAQVRAEQDEARRQRQAAQARQRETKVAEARAGQETAAARKEVESYYQAHAAALQDVLPSSLFRSELQASFPAGISPADAWLAARDLIAQMQPLVNRERERQRKVNEEKRKQAEDIGAIDKEIRTCEQRIAKLQASKSDDQDFIDDEVQALKGTVQGLKERRETFANMNG